MTMEGLYKINLIPNDLSTEETILQVADTLDNLNGIIDDVFERLMGRIKLNMDKTVKLMERVEISRDKVEKLTGMQKAIKVFSSAKYPTSITHEHYKSVFDLDGYRHSPRRVVLSGKSRGQPNDKAIQDKLHFYHVKVAQPMNRKPKPDFSLADVIDSVPTIGELLVFDTDESPYLGTISKVPAYVPRIAPSADNESLLEAAPSSILNRDVLKREADEYMYAPGMGLVPELEMPLDLPHLPGIAGDVQFSMASDGANDGSIAPSLVTSPVTATSLPIQADLPDLPGLVDATVDATPHMDLPDLPIAPAVPPAPPVAMAPVPKPTSAPPPPPPPPPPPSAPPAPPLKDLAPAAKGKRPAKPQPEPVGDAHSNLMAAIRQAGGAGRAKLRCAADTPPKASNAKGGDLMADLHAKLSMRRRGISGAERGGTVLHTLAAVIPEPESSPQRSSSEEDWE